MRLGLIARDDNSGLGMQTWEFYKHMKPAKTLVMDISDLNHNKRYPERYPDATVVHGILRAPDIDAFLQDLDVIFVAEAPYNYHLYARAKELGVKVAVQYNYEFFDWFVHPEYPKPDMLIAPSRWHYADVEKWCQENGVQHIYLHCPVSREALPPREIKQARTFLHVAGRTAAHDRNGTKTVIKASAFLETDARILVHFQGDQGLAHQTTTTTAEYEAMARNAANPLKLTIETKEYENYVDVYDQGDVLLLPRRYGGNCLPLNEALSVGMPAIMTDISPNNNFLPGNWLLPARKIGEFTPRTTIDIYDTTPVALARKIDEFYRLSEHDMQIENIRAGQLARSISWNTMRPQYEEILERLCS